MKLLSVKLPVIAFCIFFSAETTAQRSPKHEMRALWVATVNNIDWPTKPGLPSEDQKKEITELLDLAVEYRLNTIIFQIRPAADAFYNSPLEPWSQWLNSQQGKAPEPYYDPLEFVIEECRKRGLDIHAWLNPYRAVTDTANPTHPSHITNLHPEWFVVYGKTVYFDPGLQETRDHVAGVVADIVRRYNIDAVHMDDYFYPYRIAKVDFPDDSSFARNPGGFTPDRRDDWRRNNVDLIIRQLSDTIRSVKPWVEFGISPFGVWRNSDRDSSGSATKAGQTNYDDLFADIILWQKKGWIDYITPQIYWHIGFPVADYTVLADWWSRNTWGCNLYIGQAPYRINKKSNTREWRSSDQIVKQIFLNREYPNIAGSMFFSAKVLRRNPERLHEKLIRGPYRYQSLPPPNNRIIPVVPSDPGNAEYMVEDQSLHLTWSGAGDSIKNFVVYRFRKGKPATIEDPKAIFRITSDKKIIVPLSRDTDPVKYSFAVTSVSKTNTESNPVRFLVRTQ